MWRDGIDAFVNMVDIIALRPIIIKKYAVVVVLIFVFLCNILSVCVYVYMFIYVCSYVFLYDWKLQKLHVDIKRTRNILFASFVYTREIYNHCSINLQRKRFFSWICVWYIHNWERKPIRYVYIYLIKYEVFTNKSTLTNKCLQFRLLSK